MSRDPFARYRALMDAAGFRPTRSLGQNFLLDPTLHRWIVDTADPGARDVVLEVGVGLGFLTRELAERAGRVVGVEIDRRLLEIARAELHGMSNVTLVEADALGGPGRSLPDEVRKHLARPLDWGFQVVANLPYAAVGPLLAGLCVLDLPPDRAVVLVQKELAERVAAAPGTAHYGGLSALVQSLFAVRRLREVPPQVFRPRPKVASAVLRLDRDGGAPAAGAPAAARQSFRAFVQRLFQQRRKTLRSTLPPAAAAAGGRVPDLPEDQSGRRAEELGPAELWRLWEQTGG